MNLFPIIQPQMQPSENLPIYKEIKWDFLNDKPVFKRGNPVIVEGKEAVKTWAWNALKTVRKRHIIFTWNYACDLEKLIGQPYSEEVKATECKRYIRDCLLVNPYIKDVVEINVSFNKDVLSADCRLITMYGDFTIGGDSFV